MKTLKLFFASLTALLLLSACSSVRVASDYDQSVNFSNYNTFAFFKPGIDKAEISDLDKRRILRAIEDELLAKGFRKSENPALLVSIFTEAQERVDVYNNYGWGWGAFGGWGWGGWGWGGWGPYGMGMPFGNNVNRTTEGTLYIDLIDAEQKELVWQGQGTGYLADKVSEKQARINEIVGEIMKEYPPQIAKN